MLPICRLQIFEMVGFVEVKGFEVFGEDDYGVADEEVGEVGGKEVVHAAVDEALFEGFVDDEVGVHVFGAESGILGDVGGVGGVS